MIQTNVVKNLDNKNTLTKKINVLKNDIEILSKSIKNNNKNKDESNSERQLKQNKIDELKKLTEQLKDINKTERLEIQKRNQLMNTHKAIDTLHFMTAKKKKNNIDGMEKAKKAKEQRELLRQNYLKDKELEIKYLKIDPKELPASIFLHKDVLEKYGLCPFLVIDLDLDLDEDNLIKIQKDILFNRMQWLESQNDKGETYFNLYDDYFLNKHINSLSKNKEDLEIEIENNITNILSPSQKEIYLKSNFRLFFLLLLGSSRFFR